MAGKFSTVESSASQSELFIWSFVFENNEWFTNTSRLVENRLHSELYFEIYNRSDFFWIIVEYEFKELQSRSQDQ